LVVFHHRWSPPPGSVPRMSLSSMVKRRQSRRHRPWPPVPPKDFWSEFQEALRDKAR
jgi:hypothetical protein